MKRVAAGKSVALPRRKANADALDKLSENPSLAEIKNAAVNVSLAELEERVNDVRDSWETDSLFEDAFEELSNGAADSSDSKCLLDSLDSCRASGRPSSSHVRASWPGHSLNPCYPPARHRSPRC